MPNTPSGGRELEHFTTYEAHRAKQYVHICIIQWIFVWHKLLDNEWHLFSRVSEANELKLMPCHAKNH